MLRLDGVRFQRGRFALGADLDLKAGQRLAVIGASGSGKSTLLSLIAGFDPVAQGTIEMEGRDVTQWPVADRPLSILFQDGNLFPHLTVWDNVALGISPRLRLSKAQVADVEASLAKVGLETYAARKPSALSGGQQSRVALARMLLRRQPLTLLDEPFAALDPGLRRDMMNLIDSLCAETGLTLIMVSHDLRDAERLCDRLVVLDDGKIVVNGQTQALMADPPAALQPWT